MSRRSADSLWLRAESCNSNAKDRVKTYRSGIASAGRVCCAAGVAATGIAAGRRVRVSGSF